jgi:exodeoxyribonuclease V alpha subunit
MTRQLKLDLTTLHDLQLISHLDYYFAKTMAEAFHATTSLVQVACALASQAVAEGHICIDLEKKAGTCLKIPEIEAYIQFPVFEEWQQALNTSAMVGRAIEGLEDREPGLANRFPLVLDSGGNLYLSRYYDFQKRLVHNLCARAGLPPVQITQDFSRNHLDPFFSGLPAEQVEKQKQAVEKALALHFLVISGGPGTGKTYITTLIKTLLILYADACGTSKPRILSLAPTGKAASRLENGRTIHSALCPVKKKNHFLYNRENPLPADVVIVDEASMIDIALMTRLLEAIPLEAKVIFLGDKNQLSPVQAGAVFTDICRVKGLGAHLVFLSYNFRSRGKTGIENLARAINQNDITSMETILSDSQYPDIEFEDTRGEKRLDQILEKHIISGYTPLTQQPDLLNCLKNLDKFRILCAHNIGETGTLQINHLCENILRSHPNFAIRSLFFKKIVMINANDYSRGLFNGDTGIVYEENKGIRAGFQDSAGNVRQYRYLDLLSHDTAFAVTIHKSQGSEFDTVLIIIPEKLSPIVTQQLLNTGITRARKKAIIAGSLDVIKEAMTVSPDHTSTVAVLLEQRLGRNT